MKRERCWVVSGFTIALLMVWPGEAAAFWDWIHELSGPSMIGLGYTCKVFFPSTFAKAGRTVSPVQYRITTRVPHMFQNGDSVTIEGHKATVERSGTDQSEIGIEGRYTVAVDDNSNNTFVISLPVVLTARATLKPGGAVGKATKAGSPSVDIEGAEVVNESRGGAVSSDRCPGLPPANAAQADLHWWLRGETYYYFSYKHEDDPENRLVNAWSQGLMFEVSPADPAVEKRSVVFFGAGFEHFNFWGVGFDKFDRWSVKIRPFAVRVNRKMLGLKALEGGIDLRYFRDQFVPQDFGVPSTRESQGGEWTVGLFVSAVIW